MISDSLNRDEKKIAILSKLSRKTKIGMDYIPKRKVLGNIPRHARGDIDDILYDLYRQGFIEYYKSKECVSINPKVISEVIEKIRDEVPDYILRKLE